MATTTTDKGLEAGIYSIICLIDDNTWIQPIFRTGRFLTETTFRQMVEAVVDHNAFMFLDIEEDRDAPEDYIRDLDTEYALTQVD